jgi:homoserine kinase type II
MNAISAKVFVAYSQLRNAAAMAQCRAVSGGLSGASVWQFVTPQGWFALRCWPREHPPPERLRAIHAALQHAAGQGIATLAVPFPNAAGETATWIDGQAWELAPWLPGKADAAAMPDLSRVAAAFGALGELHRALRTAPRAGFSAPCSAHDVPPGLRSRIAFLDQLQQGEADALGPLIAGDSDATRRELASDILRSFWRLRPRCGPAVRQGLLVPTPLQVCLRDIWEAHVLFSDERVTGIIDYGAMEVDSVAADIARLAGSWFADDASRWETALAAYRQAAPLSEAEEQLAQQYDHANMLLAGMQWLVWIYREGRKFPAEEVLQRLQFWGRRMSIAAEQ